MVPGPGGVVWTVGTSLSGFTGTGYALGPNRGCTPTSLPCGAIAVYDFVVATNKTHTIERLLDVAFAVVDLNWRDYTVQDPAFMRPAEVDHLIGSAAKNETVIITYSGHGTWVPDQNGDEPHDHEAHRELRQDVRLEQQSAGAESDVDDAQRDGHGDLNRQP